jgi:hypothetical protein
MGRFGIIGLLALLVPVAGNGDVDEMSRSFKLLCIAEKSVGLDWVRHEWVPQHFGEIHNRKSADR